MSTLIASIGLIWLSLSYIVPKITRGNVEVSSLSFSAVPPALLASMSVLMIVSALAIVVLSAMGLAGTLHSLEVVMDEPVRVLFSELVCNAAAVTASLVICGSLLPSLIRVTSSFWALVASLPISAFMTLIFLFKAAPFFLV
ncbi:MAG: hypothetical protein SFV17_04510 [Candidatus Obscuribacter sp.]|nr:hypothetical protein [Candidatus Obscuribacter sp.]